MIELKHNTELVAAHRVYPYRDPVPIKHYDDGIGPLWLYGIEFGATMVIRAKSFESAYEIMLDESETIPEDEVHETYGFDTREEMLAHEGEWPELIEGYHYQANFSGTGIVSVSHYEWLRAYESGDSETVRLTIREQE
jgi:hypothetical protein